MHSISLTRSLFSLSTGHPVVSSTGLAEHKVVWAEQLTKGPRTNTVHGASGSMGRRQRLRTDQV